MMKILAKQFDVSAESAVSYSKGAAAEGSTFAEGSTLSQGSVTALRRQKAFILLFALLTSVALLMFTNANAQETVEHEVIENVPLNQAELDQILAPIALYPDSLLSQILVASTYPLEVVQATRWRQANSSLDEQQVLSALENKDWDPSVKALTPFEDLLVRISEDLEWLQNVGDAFLQNEDQVLTSVQNLRQKAYDNGSIADNDYYDISTENDNIIIESTEREIVYVPYYDTRVVYGDWWWDGYRPTYWHKPRNYVHLSGGFFWNAGYYIRPNIFFGGFHWGSRRLVVNQYYYDNPYRYDGYSRNIRVSNYRHWRHNPVHRRGVRYGHRAIPNNRSRSVSNRSTNRSVVTGSNIRNQSVSKTQQRINNARQGIQQRVNNIRQGTRSSGVVDRREAIRNNNRNGQPRTNTPSPSRVVVNRNTRVNQTAPTRRATPVERATQRSNTTVQRNTAATQRNSSTNNSANRSTTVQRSSNQRANNSSQSANRNNASTSSRSSNNRAYTRPSSNNSRNTGTRSSRYNRALR